MTELPQRFKERMRELLGNEYEAFEASYEPVSYTHLTLPTTPYV